MGTSWSGGGGGGRSGDWVRSSEGSVGANPYFELGIRTVKASPVPYILGTHDHHSGGILTSSTLLSEKGRV